LYQQIVERLVKIFLFFIKTTTRRDKNKIK